MPRNVICRCVAAICLASPLCGCGMHAGETPPPYTELGKTRFEAYCAACHQLGGRGIEGRVPPLTDSPWVAGPESRLIRIVLHGLRGPIEIHGETYNLEMPAFGQAFPDEEIAEMLSYVRHQYGAPSPPITAAAVSKVREATQDRTFYWTVGELLEVR